MFVLFEIKVNYLETKQKINYYHGTHAVGLPAAAVPDVSEAIVGVVADLMIKPMPKNQLNIFIFNKKLALPFTL